MDLEELIKLLNDMMLLYGNKTLLTVTDSRNEYKIVSVTGNQCAKYFEPSDHIAEVIIKIKSDDDIYGGELCNRNSNTYDYCPNCGAKIEYKVKEQEND